jgi:hypothetical protein
MRISEITQLNELRYAQLVGKEGILNKLNKANDIAGMNKVMQDLVDNQKVTQLGGKPGNYAVAYRGTEQGHAVLKISKPVQSDVQTLDQFLKISKSKPNNPLFPRVYMYQIKPDNSFWVLLEYLNIPDRSTAVSLLNDTFGITKAKAENERPITLSLVDVAKEIQDLIRSNFTRYKYKSIEDIRDNSDRTSEQKINFDLFVDFVRQISQASVKAKIDVMPQNVGLRKNGQIVFFDAIA